MIVLYSVGTNLGPFLTHRLFENVVPTKQVVKCRRDGNVKTIENSHRYCVSMVLEDIVLMY
jgi:hypothetical protein